MIIKILKNIHLVATIIWVGAVYMGAFIDWPSAKESMAKGKFPFKFIVGQGTKVFYSVYTGIFLLWFSGIGLLIIKPIESKVQILMVVVKIFCLLIMTLFTLYGTLSTWPKLQLATNQEAFRIYKYYIIRAIITFSCGIIGSLIGLNIY
jgi:uncharacterized membrane protein